MTRLIDADALLPMMKYATTDSEIGIFPIKIGFSEIVRVIDEAPTVDAVPVVHGRWELLHMWTGFETLYCSECNYETNNGSNYCPNCGADMGGEQDG